jgi:hypothetical protein
MRDFIERVVNEHDLNAIDEAVEEMVSLEYRGSGSEWLRLAPTSRPSARSTVGKPPSAPTGA